MTIEPWWEDSHAKKSFVHKYHVLFRSTTNESTSTGSYSYWLTLHPISPRDKHREMRWVEQDQARIASSGNG